MSKPVKHLLEESYRRKFADLDSAVLIDIRGIPSNDVNRLRSSLAEKQIKITIVKNSLARRMAKGTGLANLVALFDGPSAMVYGPEGAIVTSRELIRWAKELENFNFKGALMEGTVFGVDQLDALSKYPTREEAQAQTVQLALSPGQQLVGSIVSPGRKIAALIKTIEEKMENNQPIKKAG